MTRKNRQTDAVAGDDVVDEDSYEEDEDSYEEEESDEDETDDDVDDEYVDEDESLDEDDYEDEDEVEVEVPETQEERRKRLLAARAAGQPAATVEPTQSRVSTKRTIDRLDPRERRFSFFAAGAAAVFGVLVYVTETHNHSFRLAKGQFTPQTTLVIGFVAAALMVGVTLLNRRALVGFVALITAFSFAQSSYLWGAPFFVLAVWLLVRSYRVQKEASAKLRAARGSASSARPTPASRSGSRPAAPSRPTTVAEARRARAKKSSAPVGNKRYTPKRPVPPPPKPSRRERKATASD
ncbi:MAG TPA: hypothetical protein VHT49_10240 [Acidimicrobiales bacterium]|jgi:hypothetical protein|nr:hypothetical protein [Acidimicrobiales bacterium]